ncbi:hypothetical protein B0A54_03714 [Friedmanniomyces endolithicus]|uniref:Uncharacterized protein n=1 Tax=Friedmanniomyces endolithicus TaxID=329885 RepID=A0A4U0VCR1_9PEZI|nr:hypothetical protein B0A54_03714 [Friedmanniomyces endolithicus]
MRGPFTFALFVWSHSTPIGGLQNLAYLATLLYIVSSNNKDVIVIKKDDVAAKDTIKEAPIDKYYYNSEALYIDIKTQTAKINLEKAIRLGDAKEYTRGSV